MTQGLEAAARRGRTRTSRPLKPGVALAMGSSSASANRMRAAQAEDSAITVIVPPSRLQRFTLLARSGPNASITATCHSDASGAERARWARAGRRADIKSRAVTGLPGRLPCLSRWGLLGIVSRPLGLTVLPVKTFDRERTTRMPALCKSLKYLEPGRAR